MLISRRLLIIGLISTLLFINPNSVAKLDTGNVQTDLTEGVINGISYKYGLNTFTASGNASRVNNGTIQEYRNVTVSENRTLDLIMSADYLNTWYQFNERIESPNRNETRSFYRDDDGLQAFVDNVNNTIASLNSPTNITRGRELLALNITNAVDTVETIYVDQRERFLGQAIANVTGYEYNRVYLNGTVVHHSGTVAARAIILNVTRQAFDLNVTRTRVRAAYMGYYTEFARAYNISASAYQVKISNGENFKVDVNMFNKISANYTEYAISYLGYSLTSIDLTTLKFANGTVVPYQYYPRNMLPKVFKNEGTIIEAGYKQVNSELLSTFNSVTSAFATVNDTSTNDSVSIEARLAVWGIQTSTTMAAYEDGNGNGQLDLAMSETGLEVASDDRVSHIGLAEAYQVSEFTARYKSHVYNSSVVLYGLGVNITENNVNNTAFDTSYQEFTFGNFNQNITTNFNWTDPVVEDDGTVRFEFGVDYDNFPVTWINVQDGTVTEDSEDIGYHYVVRVNPTTGRARISPTWVYGGVTDPGLNAEMADKSLALMVKSEFFAVQASYTATQSNETVNSTEASAFARVGIRVGNSNATEIDVTGPKQFYTLNGTSNETASFSVVNLVQVSGSLEAERTSPFNSESGNTAGTASTSVVETLSVNFFYSANLIVISYDKWSGASIVHDPDYNVEYAKVATPASTTTSSSAPSTSTTPSTTTSSASATPTTTSSSTSTTTSTTTSSSSTPTSASSETPAQSDASTSDAAAPGFEFYLLISGVITVITMRRKKNNN